MLTCFVTNGKNCMPAPTLSNQHTFRYCQQCDKQETTLDNWTRHKQAHHTPLHTIGRAGSPPPPRVAGGYQNLVIPGPVVGQHINTVYGMHDQIMVLELTEPAPPVNTMPVPSDLFDLLNRRRTDVRTLVSMFMTQHRRIKISLGLRTRYARIRTEGRETIDDYTRTPAVPIDNVGSDFLNMYDRAIDNLWKYTENFVRQGSNWTVEAFRSVLVHCYALPPLRVGSYQRTPRELGRKRCITNVVTQDNFCLKWSIVASVVHKRATEEEKKRWLTKELAQICATYHRLAHHWSDLDFSGITPGELITGHTVECFEKRNPKFAVNIFHYLNVDADVTSTMRPGKLTQDEKNQRKLNISQFHVSKHVHDPSRQVLNLLLLEHPGTGDHHLVSITNLNIFFNRGGRPLVVCPKCLQTFSGRTKDAQELAFQKHVQQFCARREFDKYNVNFPETTLSFTKAYYSMQLPFLLFADFETWGQTGGNRLNHNTAQRRIINRHHLMGYSIGVVTTPGVSDHLQSRFTLRTYSGPYAEQHFIADFISLKTLIQKAVADMEQQHGTLKPYAEFTPEERQLAEATHCHICKLPITQHDSDWKTHQRVWENDYGLHGGLVTDDDSLPEGYWRGPHVIDHCHIR